VRPSGVEVPEEGNSESQAHGRKCMTLNVLNAPENLEEAVVDALAIKALAPGAKTPILIPCLAGGLRVWAILKPEEGITMATYGTLKTWFNTIMGQWHELKDLQEAKDLEAALAGQNDDHPLTPEAREGVEAFERALLLIITRGPAHPIGCRVP